MLKTFNKKALTLLEIIVSLTVLSLTIWGFANLFIATRRLTAHTRSRLVAVELIGYWLDPLWMEVREDQWGSNCISTDGTDTGGCDTTPVTLNNIDFTPTYEKSSVVGTTIHRLKLTVSWDEPT